jgi:hypothetical protein
MKVQRLWRKHLLSTGLSNSFMFIVNGILFLFFSFFFDLCVLSYASPKTGTGIEIEGAKAIFDVLKVNSSLICLNFGGIFSLLHFCLVEVTERTIHCQ